MGLESFFEERLDLSKFIENAEEYSFLNVYQTDLVKVLIVAAASSFETIVVDHIEEFYRSSSSYPSAAVFVKNKALFRSYHQLFDWSTSNANTFTKFFGQDCTDLLKSQLNDHPWLEQSIRDFIALGRARNELVHGDFAVASPSLSVAEVGDKYRSAIKFVDAIPSIIRVERLVS